MIKAILFDLDNTLIDFMRMKKICVSSALDAMIDAGLKMSKRDAEKKLYELYDVYGIEYELIFQKFLEKHVGKVDMKILSSAIVAYRRVRSGVLEPYPGVERTLIKLKEKGLKLAIVSDAPKLKAWIRLVSMDIDDFFDFVITSDKTPKPHSLPFYKALEKLQVEPENVLMVGDNIKKDIMGAKKLGMKTCFAKYGHIGKKKIKSGADYEIDKFEDLLKVIT